MHEGMVVRRAGWRLWVLNTAASTLIYGLSGAPASLYGFASRPARDVGGRRCCLGLLVRKPERLCDAQSQEPDEMRRLRLANQQWVQEEEERREEESQRKRRRTDAGQMAEHATRTNAAWLQDRIDALQRPNRRHSGGVQIQTDAALSRFASATDVLREWLPDETDVRCDQLLTDTINLEARFLARAWQAGGFYAGQVARPGGFYARQVARQSNEVASPYSESLGKPVLRVVGRASTKGPLGKPVLRGRWASQY